MDAAFAPTARTSPIRPTGGHGSEPGEIPAGSAAFSTLPVCSHRRLTEREEPPTPDLLERQRQELRDGGFNAPDRQSDMDSSESDADLPPSLDRAKELRERKLDDIQEEKEDALRGRNLDDININVIPREVAPPNLW